MSEVEKVTMNGKEYYTFPHDTMNPGVIYEKLPNGRFTIAGIKRSKTDGSKKSTKTTQSKKINSEYDDYKSLFLHKYHK